MTRDRGDWIPWYCDDSPGWLELSLAARGIAEGIARKMGRSRSELHLGSRGLRGLCMLLRARWEEFKPAMAELLAEGPNGEPPRLVLSEDHRILIDPEHESRRRPTSSERVNEWRRKKKDRAANDAANETHATVTSVSATQKRREEKRSEDPPLPPAPAPRAASGTALAMELCAVYEATVSEVTGRPFALSGPGPRTDLLAAANKHGPWDSAATVILNWLRTSVRTWTSQHRDREQFTGGWAPRHFLEWLNGGSKPPADVKRTGTDGGASPRARRELT